MESRHSRFVDEEFPEGMTKSNLRVTTAEGIKYDPADVEAHEHAMNHPRRKKDAK